MALDKEHAIEEISVGLNTIHIMPDDRTIF